MRDKKKKPNPDDDSAAWHDEVGHLSESLEALRGIGRTLASAPRELRHAWKHRHDDDQETPRA